MWPFDGTEQLECRRLAPAQRPAFSPAQSFSRIVHSLLHAEQRVAGCFAPAFCQSVIWTKRLFLSTRWASGVSSVNRTASRIPWSSDAAAGRIATRVLRSRFAGILTNAAGFQSGTSPTTASVEPSAATPATGKTLRRACRGGGASAGEVCCKSLLKRQMGGTTA